MCVYIYNGDDMEDSHGLQKKHMIHVRYVTWFLSSHMMYKVYMYLGKLYCNMSVN